MRAYAAFSLVVLAFALSSCKLIPTSEVRALEESKGGAPFDPDKMVADIWTTKVLPYLDGRAGPFVEVRDLAQKDGDAAGAKFGYREKSDGTPWTYVVRLQGVVLSANTQSRAASMEIDATGGGKADAVVQLGPVMRGTALRDALDFVKFGDFINQIDFAQFGKAFNTYAYHAALEKLPREALVGKHVKVLGAYTAAAGDAAPIIAPASVEIEAAP
jgi:predicted lipoprotein